MALCRPAVAVVSAMLACASAAPLCAQAPAMLRARVTDTTGAPLADAHLRLLEARAELATGREGTAAFTPLAAGPYTLVARALGYAGAETAVVLRAGLDTTIVFVLRPRALELPEVAATATIGERAGAERAATVTVLEGAALDRRMDGTVAAVVAGTPGVATGSIGPATARPVIRGLGADRILVLEDGQRPGDLSSTSADHAVAVDPLTARRVEVVRGPQSLLYGSSAMGGVVNVIRDEIPTTRPAALQGDATVQAASVNRAGGAATALVTPVGRTLALRIEATARGAGDIRTPIGALVNTQSQLLGGAVALARVGERGHAGLSYRFQGNDYGIPGGFIGAHPRGVDIVMRRHTVRAEAERRPAGGAFTSLRLVGTFTGYMHDEFEASGIVGTSFAQALAQVEGVARHRGTGLRAEGAIGVRAQYRDIRVGGSLRSPDTRDVSIAAFAVEEFGRGPVRVTAGARVDVAHFVPSGGRITAGGVTIDARPRTFGSVSGALGVTWRAATALRLGASLNRSYRTPDFNELYSNGPHLAANTFDVGDPNLRQETGFGADVWARWSTNRVNAELAAYANRFDDFIYPTSRGRAELGTSGGVPRFQFTNQDARFVGAEGSVSVALTRRLVVEGSASVVQARLLGAIAPVPVFGATDTTFIAGSPFPPLIPPAFGAFGLRYDAPRWFAGASMRWAAAQRRVGDFEAPTSGWAVVGLQAGVRFLLAGRLHAVTLRLDNLTDRVYREHLNRARAVMPEPGRNVALLWRVAF